MATIHFCGATGKVFRGSANVGTQWLHCKEPERPTHRFEDIDETWKEQCRKCPLYLRGTRQRNEEPYCWTPPKGYEHIGYGIAVAGGGIDTGVLRRNRERCGRRLCYAISHGRIQR